MGYPLHWAKEFIAEDGTRTVILATDRPVTTREAVSSTRSADFDVSVVVLTLDKSGKGDGAVSIGTEVTWNEKTDRLKVNQLSGQATKVTDVRNVD